MTIQRAWTKAWRGFFVTAAAGMTFVTSCSSNDVQQAVLVGVETAANQLLNTPQHDDISFGDWLADELKD